MSCNRPWCGPRTSCGPGGRCWSGLNRSGLLTAQTLIEQGHDAHTAIGLVRKARSGSALNNTIFVDYLITGLSVSSLLSGLGV